MRCNIEPSLLDVKFVDAQRVFHKMEPRNLTAAYKYYCNKDLENAHSAKADTEATMEIILSQVQKYEELAKTPEGIHEFTGQDKIVDLAGRFVRNKDGDVCFNFGKYKGQSFKAVMEANQGYYDWMMKGDFPLDTKRKLTKIKLQGFQLG